jgi:hypothetical protein
MKLVGILSLLFCLGLYVSTNSVYADLSKDSPIIVTVPSIAQFHQVVAISDIHGNPEKLVSLFRHVGIINANQQYIGKNTLLIIVGDSIQKGLQSLAALDFLIKLEQQMTEAGGQMIHLLGNHENDQLAGNPPKAELLHELEQAGLSDEHWLDPDSRYGKFFKKMPLLAIISDAAFIHSGYFDAKSRIDFEQTWGIELTRSDHRELLSKSSPLENKQWLNDRSDFALNLHFMHEERIQMIGFGHNRKAVGSEYENEIIKAIHGKLSFLKLDTGFFTDENNNGQLIRWKTSANTSLSQLPSLVYRLDGGTSPCNEILIHEPIKKARRQSRRAFKF